MPSARDQSSAMGGRLATFALVLASQWLMLRLPATAALAVSPRDVHAYYPRAPAPFNLGDLNPFSWGISVNDSFDLGWQMQDQPLFSASWSGGLGKIPVGPVLESSGAGNFSLTVECADCRTTGTITATFDERDVINAAAKLTFHNVAAYFDLGLVSSSDGVFSIGIGRSLGTGNATGGVLTAGFDIGLDLILGVSGPIEASGGFMISIPDGETVGFDINVEITDIIKARAGLNVIPQVHFGLLPLVLNDTAVNITAALRLQAHIGIAVAEGGTKGSFEAGGMINLAEATLGVVSPAPSSCAGQVDRVAVFAEVGSNAGAFLDAEADFLAHQFSAAPSVSTVFFTAATTTCLVTASQQPTLQPFASTAAYFSTPSGTNACPNGDWSTSTTTVVNTYALTSCVVPAVNCPASLTQLILVTNAQEAVTTFCAGSAAATATTTTPTSSSHGPTSTTTTTTSTATQTVTVATISDALTLEAVKTLAGATLDLANVTRPINATLTGSFLVVETENANGTNSSSGASRALGPGGNDGLWLVWRTGALLAALVAAGVLLL